MPPGILPAGIEPFDAANKVKENAHLNFKHHFKPGHSYNVTLNNKTGLEAYNLATKNIQWLIANAIENDVRIRAMGSNWSLSPVASSESMINTKALNLRFTLSESSLSNAYFQSGKTKDDVLFLECGCMIWDLNKYMETRNGSRRCLRASGASNGQTIAGATSTGTHGAALFTGSVHDAILGLHIVTGPDSHVWLERASQPVVSDSFVNKLGATLIRDDDMFNAAVVSFGSFGVIHGVLMETDPIYVLKEHRFKVPYTDVLKEAIRNLDFTALRAIIPEFPEDTPENMLYHLDISINIHRFEKDNVEKPVYIQALFKQPCSDDYEPVHDFTASTASYSKDTMGLVSQVIDALGTNLQNHLIRPMVNALFESGLKVQHETAKTIGELFSFTRFRGQVASATLAVDTADVFEALEAIAELNEQSPFAGGVALRFVKGTSALLGFTKFENTCVLELDGIDGEVTREFIKKAWLKLEQLNIPYTIHWGKFNSILNAERVRKMYGDDKVDKWLECREQLLSSQAQRVFTNKFMEQCGLINTVDPPIV